jgi:hypothetical protein
MQSTSPHSHPRKFGVTIPPTLHNRALTANPNRHIRKFSTGRYNRRSVCGSRLPLPFPRFPGVGWGLYALEAIFVSRSWEKDKNKMSRGYGRLSESGALFLGRTPLIYIYIVSYDWFGLSCAFFGQYTSRLRLRGITGTPSPSHCRPGAVGSPMPILLCTWPLTRP